MLSRITFQPSLAHLLLVAALSAAPLLTDCDSGGPDEPVPGSFSVHVGDEDGASTSPPAAR